MYQFSESVFFPLSLGTFTYLLRPETARVIANTFGQGTGPIWLDDMACTGTETRLDECPHKGWGQADCAHNEDVAVKCEVTSISPTVPAIPTTTKSPTVVQGSNCRYIRGMDSFAGDATISNLIASYLSILIYSEMKDYANSFYSE